MKVLKDCRICTPCSTKICEFSIGDPVTTKYFDDEWYFGHITRVLGEELYEVTLKNVPVVIPSTSRVRRATESSWSEPTSPPTLQPTRALQFTLPAELLDVPANVTGVNIAKYESHLLSSMLDGPNCLAVGASLLAFAGAGVAAIAVVHKLYVAPSSTVRGAYAIAPEEPLVSNMHDVCVDTAEEPLVSSKRDFSVDATAAEEYN